MTEILSTEYRAYLAVLESGGYGVDAVDAAITAGDDLVFQAFGSAMEITLDERYDNAAQARPGVAGLPSAHVPTHGTFTLPMPLRAGVGADFTPEYDWALRFSGYAAVVTGGTSTVYTKQSLVDESATIYEYRRNLLADNWRLRRLLGCVAQHGVVADAVGNEAVMNFNGAFRNYAEHLPLRSYFDASDQPALDFDGASYTYAGTASASSAARMQCQNLTATFDSVDIPLSRFEFTPNEQVAVVESMLEATETGARVLRQRPDNSNAEVLLAFNMADPSTPGAFYAKALTDYQADTRAALSISWDNGSRKVTYSFPSVQLRRPNPRAENQSLAWNCVASIAGDESNSIFGEGSVVITHEAA